MGLEILWGLLPARNEWVVKVGERCCVVIVHERKSSWGSEKKGEMRGEGMWERDEIYLGAPLSFGALVCRPRGDLSGMGVGGCAGGFPVTGGRDMSWGCFSSAGLPDPSCVG